MCIHAENEHNFTQTLLLRSEGMSYYHRSLWSWRLQVVAKFVEDFTGEFYQLQLFD